ncbi:MAG: copper amine oxidase N-terminal domain-containing protein [Clostridiales bacterium]|nr:copper amine oxidase N-terminal domain-containing protein [Clostridiales bacterium]
MAAGNNVQLLVIDGVLVPALAYADDVSIYLPMRAVVEALGGNYTDTNGVVQAINMTIEMTASPSVISINGLFYELGAEHKRIGGELYLPVPVTGFTMKDSGVGNIVEINGLFFELPANVKQMLDALYRPSGGNISLSIKQANVTNFGTPIVLMETAEPKGEKLLAHPIAYRDYVLAAVKAVDAIALAQTHLNKDWFAGRSISDFIGAKSAVSTAVSTASLVGDYTYYYAFDAGTFSFIVNKYTGEYFLAGGGAVMTVEEGNLFSLVE